AVKGYRCKVAFEYFDEKWHKERESEGRCPIPSLEGKCLEIQGEPESLLMASTTARSSLLSECLQKLAVIGYSDVIAVIWVQDRVWGCLHCLRKRYLILFLNSSITDATKKTIILVNSGIPKRHWFVRSVNTWVWVLPKRGYWNTRFSSG